MVLALLLHLAITPRLAPPTARPSAASGSPADPVPAAPLLPGPERPEPVAAFVPFPAVPADAGARRPVPLERARTSTAAPKSPVRKIPAKEITRRLDRYLAARPGPVTAMVKDLTTGRLYRYHRSTRLITASTAKVQILMALLLRTPWRKLPKDVRRDAEIMIRYSDNHAADRLWLRVGGAPGFTKAGRRFGLRHTQGIPGDCVDLYCWGITPTSAEDQVRLLAALARPKSPLKAADRERVLKLMSEVVAGQDWGVSAVAVLTENSPEVGYGIATVEGIVERIMPSFRKCRK
ncbi:serine hydrolase [Nonomuraea antri]|uniref:serine hydrolase n=1 Tax=Nonomuraea antri TaxID=2730852 RepID=UPI002E2A4E19|nr:serine hydrolase [Nonomuraea antri]